MRSFGYVVAVMICTVSLAAQQSDPEITSWILNTTGQTGYGGIPSNVQVVRYSEENVYVSCTCIPGYDIGPWTGNPNTPANQNFVFKITRSPRVNDGTPTATPRGHIGVWTNGVSVFNGMDARSYNNRNIWNQNAVVVEGSSFDDCLGHPAPNGEYHHHLNPRCLYDDHDSSRHSPIIGYAFDGFPIYGAFGSGNPDGTGPITRMRSSFRLRSMADRSTLADGTVLSQADQGPAFSVQYPRGYYLEDFEFVTGLGDLDEHNGRFCVTPEYPEGTYAYFVTLDDNLEAEFPYVLGPTYKGVVPAGNTGPQSGHNTPSEPVTTYTVSGIDDDVANPATIIYPNPASHHLFVRLPSGRENRLVRLTDLTGREREIGVTESAEGIAVSLDGIEPGAYVLTVFAEGVVRTAKVAVSR